eukprot:NODE_20540_length_793_cov_2.852853.p4 GENE.NODE_20540_length_793_cov_2.852853~~NODE_20540_length_793_cov_2.852853.p4  ORF type:complete len:61 (+),score=14.09 NODE_20540_length_793_cov_2.852853:191-373(+)
MRASSRNQPLVPLPAMGKSMQMYNRVYVGDAFAFVAGNPSRGQKKKKRRCKHEAVVAKKW